MGLVDLWFAWTSTLKTEYLNSMFEDGAAMWFSERV